MKHTITVIVMTYNQKDYIRESLDSILRQKTNVDFNILIHDDCSSDGTSEIIDEYKKQYPDKIEVIHQKERTFLVVGFNGMLCSYVAPIIESEYIAYCDGDDYWCDDKKLQKQYDFMSSHPGYSMCFHSAYQIRPNNDMSSKWFIKDEGDIDMFDIISERPGVCVATSSIFLKSDVFKDFSDWRKKYPVEDVPMYITAAMKGKIHRLKDVMCVYRQFAAGSWSAQNKGDNDKMVKNLNEMKEAVLRFDEQTNQQYHDLVVKEVESFDFRIAHITRDLKTIFSKVNKRFVKRLKFKERFSLKLQYRAPSLYNLLKKKKS